MRVGQLVAVFAIGLAAGAWVFASPWVVGYPNPAQDGWSSSTWATVWAGATVAVASAISLVVVLARALHLASRQRPL